MQRSPPRISMLKLLALALTLASFAVSAMSDEGVQTETAEDNTPPPPRPAAPSKDTPIGSQVSMILVGIMAVVIVVAIILRRNQAGIPGSIFEEPTGRPGLQATKKKN